MDDGNDCTGREEGTEMSAIEQIIAWMKKRSLTSAQLAKQAEAELAALQAELTYFRNAFRSSAKKYAEMVERQKA